MKHVFTTFPLASRLSFTWGLCQAAKIAVSILLYGKLKKLQFLDQVKVAHNAAPAVWVIRRLHKLGRVIFEVSQHCNISEKTLEKVCCNSAAFSFKKSLDLNMRM